MSTYWAWTEEQLRGFDLRAGDEMNFMGSQFNLTDTLEFVSGVTYQSGNDNTIVTGFKTLTGWQVYSGNIYYITLNQDEVNEVVVNDNLHEMGRYPNSGFITYTSHNGNSSVGGFSLPTNFVGGEAVIKKFRFALDRHTITEQGVGNISINPTVNHGHSSYEPTDGNGFIIQGHLSTLDRDKDWFFDKSTHRLYMLFEGSPTQYTVKVALPKLLIQLSNKINVTIRKLEFEGADTLFNVGGATSILVDHCSFSDTGSAIIGGYTDNFQLSDSKVFNCTNSGVYIEAFGNNTTIQRCDFWNIGLLTGMGGSGDNKLIAILVSGNNTFVSYNTFKDIGFNAVHFSGSNVTVKRNLVDRFNITKDDGAGIYCYASPNETFANIFIGENIILNAIGCPEGAGYNGDLQGESAGIYLDGNTNHAIVANNFIANGRWPGIVQLSNAHNTIINNTVYNCGRGYSNSEAANSPTGLIRDIFVRYNTFISGKPEEVCLQMTQWGLNEPFTNEGDVNYNAYLNPFGGKIVGIWYPPYGEYKEMHLEEWKQYGLDQNSFQSSIRVSSINDIKMEYNYSPVDKEVPLNGAYQGIWGDVHYNSIKIAPYRGVVLFKIYE